MNKVQKSSYTFENIISKIIKDRVYEARLVLNPVSFAVFRLVFKSQVSDSMILEDAISRYQKEFHKLLSSIGDLIWLTADTVFFVYGNADLFVAESLANDVKSKIEQLCEKDESQTPFSLKYACISYPQSGENAVEIINSLWLKLFEEIYLMEQ